MISNTFYLASQQVDERIINKIHRLVQDGIPNIKKMQRALRVYFKTEFFDAKQLPHGNSRRFYPEDRGIRNHMITQHQDYECPK